MYCRDLSSLAVGTLVANTFNGLSSLQSLYASYSGHAILFTCAQRFACRLLGSSITTLQAYAFNDTEQLQTLYVYHAAEAYHRVHDYDVTALCSDLSRARLTTLGVDVFYGLSGLTTLYGVQCCCMHAALVLSTLLCTSRKLNAPYLVALSSGSFEGLSSLPYLCVCQVTTCCTCG